MVQTYFMPIYNTIVGLLIGLLVTKLKDLNRKKKEAEKNEDDIIAALKDGMAIILKHELFDYWSLYKDSEFIPASEWDDIEKCHDAYHKLDGNHTGDRIYGELLAKHIGG